MLYFGHCHPIYRFNIFCPLDDLYWNTETCFNSSYFVSHSLYIENFIDHELKPYAVEIRDASSNHVIEISFLNLFSNQNALDKHDRIKEKYKKKK